MSELDIKRRANRAALAGAVKGIREELPNYTIRELPIDRANLIGVVISHPTAMKHEIYVWIKV